MRAVYEEDPDSPLRDDFAAMVDPVISVIIPAYNSSRFLGTTLDSLIAQRFHDWECVIVDDGSQDDTPAIASAYAERDARFRVIRQENAGVARARNRGFAASNPVAPYVTFMDNDDVYHPDALQVMADTLLRDSAAVAVHALADMIDADGKPLAPGGFAGFCRDKRGLVGNRIRPLDVTEPIPFSGILIKGVYPPGAVLARRSGYDKAGLFDPQFRVGDDFDMLIRLARHGHFRVVDRVLVYYRRHGKNASAQSVQLNRKEFNLTWYKTFYSPDNSREHIKVLKKAYPAYQIHKCCEKLSMVKDNLRAVRPARAALHTLHLAVYFGRYLRGFPTKNG
jgi:glycosyltransferase involved in cell wall biosynthesis